MEQIIVTHPDGSTTPLLSRRGVSSLSKAEQKVALLGDDVVEISVSSAYPIEFALGDTIEVFGITYTLNVLPDIKKTGTKRFTYDLTFEGLQYELIDAQFLLPEETTTGDSLTADLTRFLQILLSNIARVFPGKWALGEYPAATEYKTLTFTGENCLSVLQSLCNEYGQEFEITQNNGIRTLNIRTAGTNFPYTFRYGKTGGLYELTRKNINSKNLVTRLFVYGGSSNLGNKYRHSRLCLPGKSKNGSYIQNPAVIAAFGLKENTKTFDTIFPNRYGEVTSKGTKYYAFVDATMNFDLNEKEADGIKTKWLIAGVNAKVKVTTGNLAGYEFDVHKYDHATKTIEVVPFTDENGMKFPSETSAAFQFGVGDKYFFVDINLPDSYKTDAEAALQEEGETYYAQNCQPQVQYGLNIDQNFIEQFAGNLTVVNLFAVGDYVPVKDEDIGVDKSIRILGFTRDLLKPYKYALNLGDSVTKSAYTRVISDMKTIDKIVEINNLTDPSKARRNWRASQEVLSMVFDMEGDYYSDKIKPLSIDTTMLSVGAKSMQFILRDVVFEPNYLSNPNNLRISGGQLIHYTIEDIIRAWNLATVTYSDLASNTAYYIYARCSKAEDAGSIILDTAQRLVDSEPGYYTFSVGVLNSVMTDEGGVNPARLISLTYGSTTINGKFIRTGKIESTDGECYLDLDGNGFRVGDAASALEWNKNNDKTLRLRGTIVQSPSGTEDAIGVNRGNYNASTQYYKGDMVYYDGSTYKYIYDTPTIGATPPNYPSVWQIFASQGADGQYTSFVYKASETQPPTPTSTDPVPDGWTVDTGLEVFDPNPVYSGGAWFDYEGYKRVDWGAAGGTFSKHRCTFTTVKDNSVMQFEMVALTANAMLIGILDNPGLTATSNYTDSIKGVNVSKVVSIAVPTAGTHYIEFAYNRTKSDYGGAYAQYKIASATQPIDETIPVWMSKAIVADGIAGQWSAPMRVTGKDGEDGKPGDDGSPGKDGRIFNYTGDYDATKIYLGNDKVAQVVRVNIGTSSAPAYQWYYTTPTAHEFSNIAPPDTSKWASYGANFESVATSLLFAEKALIAGFNFYNDRIESQVQTGGIPNILLNGITGEAIFTGKIQSAVSGQRFVLDPTSGEWCLYNPSGSIVGQWKYFNSGSKITLKQVSGALVSTDYGVDGIVITRNGDTVYAAGNMSLTNSNYSTNLVRFSVNGSSLTAILRGLPTSSSGLPSGYLWRDGSTLKIVP